MNNFKNICDFDISKLKIPAKKHKILLSNLKYTESCTINELSLSQYVDHCDSKLGEYSILVVTVKTNNGIVIMKYSEGFRGSDIFDSTITILEQFNGLSSLINRALIELQL